MDFSLEFQKFHLLLLESVHLNKSTMYSLVTNHPTDLWIPCENSSIMNFSQNPSKSYIILITLEIDFIFIYANVWVMDKYFREIFLGFHLALLLIISFGNYYCLDYMLRRIWLIWKTWFTYSIYFEQQAHRQKYFKPIYQYSVINHLKNSHFERRLVAIVLDQS